MDGQNPNQKKQTHTHGLRLIKGHATNQTKSMNQTQEQPTTVNRKNNPLVRQLSALADALDQDVKQLLNL